MTIWRIFKEEPHREMIVIAETFDEALAIARETDPDFNSGQPV